ncbi:MAG: cupin domain-containing protein [Sphingomonadaceae bacterium]
MARRVVTGLNAAGKSCVVIDGEIPAVSEVGGVAWHTDSHPVDNSGSEDAAPAEFSFDLMHAGSTFMIHRYVPGQGEFWHATDTTDYIVMLEGEVTLLLEAGEVTLRKGDLCVDRGINHCWRNDSGADAVAAIIAIPARPIGKGRTV